VEADALGGVGLVAAVAAGFLSFASPCVLPMVPGYLSVITGVAPRDLDEADWRKVLGPSLLFVASFSAIFIALGMTATGFGSLLRDNLDLLTTISGVIVIALGVFFIATRVVTRLNQDFHVDALAQRAGKGGPLVAGAAFGIAWTPCVGPTLAAILSAAALSESVARGGILLAAYAAGLAIPFLLTAVAFARMSGLFTAVRKHESAIMIAGGTVLIVFGVMILTGELFRLNIEAQRLIDSIGINVSGEF
jgi:cytochrome c-type biogenesis protein